VVEATFVVGRRGTIEGVDDAVCDLLGYRPDELVGLHGSLLVPPERHVRTALSLDRMRHGDLAFREGVLQHKEGTLIPVEVWAEPRPEGKLRLTVRRRSTA
jgi:PAS domain S-box-containing protein